MIWTHTSPGGSNGRLLLSAAVDANIVHVTNEGPLKSTELPEALRLYGAALRTLGMFPRIRIPLAH